MENEEKKYTEADLRASHDAGLLAWLSTNAFRVFVFFGLGLCTGFLLGVIAMARPACGV